MRITLPSKLELENIQSTLMAIKTAGNDASIKAIVLEGQSDVFCLGMSFDYLASNTNTNTHHAIDLFAELIHQIHLSVKPTLAVVRGKALAGGAGLAAACDFIIAGEKASFGFSEALFGLLPGIILPFLLQRISAQKAKQLILSAHTITAQQAFKISLVDEMVATDQLEICLQTWVKNFTRIDSQIVGKVKKMVADVINEEVGGTLQQGTALLKEALANTQIMNNIHEYAEYGIVPWERQYDKIC